MSSASLAKLTAKLTPKQKKFFQVYAKTLNSAEAAMQAYDCKDRDVAASIGNENLRKLDFQQLMDAMGLDDENLLKAGHEGLNKAIKPVVINGKLQAVPDYATRHKYWDTFLKLKGKLADKIELTGEDGGPLQMQLVAGIGFINKPDDQND